MKEYSNPTAGQNTNTTTVASLKRLVGEPLFALLSVRPLITAETLVFEGERYLETKIQQEALLS